MNLSEEEIAKIECESFEEHDARLDQFLIDFGYKKCYQIHENNFNRPEEIWERFIHPVSGGVYRYQDISIIMDDFPDNDDTIFYKNAKHWSKNINKLLKKENCEVKENDIFGFKYVGELDIEDPDYFKIEFFLKPRPIKWEDLTDNLKGVQYWKEKFNK